jgi:hypothetical protein
MSGSNPRSERRSTRAQDIFKEATPEQQSLIRECLKDERDVMHLRRRSDIHQRIYEHVKRVIK